MLIFWLHFLWVIINKLDFDLADESRIMMCEKNGCQKNLDLDFDQNTAQAQNSRIKFDWTGN